MNPRTWNIFIWIFIIAAIWSILKPKRRDDYPRRGQDWGKPTYNVSVSSNEVYVDGNQVSAADGLDLEAVGGLVKEAKTAEDFERLLNDSERGINNLDLDEDGKVDFIKVTEYGSGNFRGFSLTVELAGKEEQEVATIEVEKDEQGNAQVQLHGNEQIYGHNHYYRSSFSPGSALLIGYLFGAHRPYFSPFHYGVYPSYYRSYPIVSPSVYRTRTEPMRKTTTYKSAKSTALKSTAKSPNAGKVAKTVKAPLKNPTASQKSFQARNPSKSTKSGGFGRKSGSSTTVAKSSSNRSSIKNTSSSQRSFQSRSSSKSSSSGGFGRSSSSRPSVRSSSSYRSSSFSRGGK